MFQTQGGQNHVLANDTKVHVDWLLLLAAANRRDRQEDDHEEQEARW
jgi:hypothetical protein